MARRLDEAEPVGVPRRRALAASEGLGDAFAAEASRDEKRQSYRSEPKQLALSFGPLDATERTQIEHDIDALRARVAAIPAEIAARQPRRRTPRQCARRPSPSS